MQRALCSSGKLTSISLVCQESVEMSWLKAVVSSNPHLQKLCLSLIWLMDYGEAGELSIFLFLRFAYMGCGIDNMLSIFLNLF